MRKPTLSCAIIITLAVVLPAAGTADAALVGGTCTGGKLKAAAKKARAKLTCHRTAASKGVTTVPGCLTSAEAKFDSAFNKAESKPPCYAMGDAPAIEAKVDNFVSGIVSDLRPALTESNCAAGQLGSTGKKAAGKLTCHQKAAKKGVAVDPECLTTAEGKFDVGFANAVAKGDCLSASTAATIEAAVDAFVAEIVDDLRPGPLSVCSGVKLERTAQKQLDKLRCHSTAATAGTTVDSTCLTNAETQFDAGFTAAETFADCLVPTGDAAAIEARVDTFVGDVESALRPVMTLSKCAGRKLTETGRETNQKLSCRFRSVRNGLPQSVNCPNPADVKFTSAENIGDCITLSDETAIEALIDVFVDDVYTDLVIPTTTTSTTTTTL